MTGLSGSNAAVVASASLPSTAPRLHLGRQKEAPLDRGVTTTRIVEAFDEGEHRAASFEMLAAEQEKEASND